MSNSAALLSLTVELKTSLKLTKNTIITKVKYFLNAVHILL